MARIQTSIEIAAPIDRCFQLALNTDVHAVSAAQTRERVVSATGSKIMGTGDEVTFEAVHFGIKWRLSSKIVEFDAPQRFVDEMVAGPFRKLRHEHLFSVVSDSTIQMTDNLEFESPYGLLGALVDQVILSSYLKSFLRRRAEVLKNLAEQASHKPNRIPSTS